MLGSGSVPLPMLEQLLEASLAKNSLAESKLMATNRTE